MKKDLNLNEKQNFIFDLDGTLVDSMWIWDSLLIDFLAGYKYDAPRELLSEVAYMSMEQSSVRVCEFFDLPMTPNEIIREWTDMIYDSYAHKVKLKPGAYEYLEHLKKNNRSVALATASSKELAEVCLKNNGIIEYFDVMTFADEVGEGKSSPKIYLKTLERLNVCPKTSVLFEDVLQALKTAKSIALDVVIVEDVSAENDKHILKQEADLYINNFNDIVFI